MIVQTLRGRPRDPALNDAVLVAATELLIERGLAGLRMQDVAHRAGVGIGAVYRRWAGKRALLLDVLQRTAPDRSIPETDDPVADFLDGLVAISEDLAGGRARLLVGLLADLADDPELPVLIRESVIAPLRAGQRRRLRRVVGDTADLDARADLGPAYILFQGAVLGAPPTREELRDRLLPLLLSADQHALEQVS